MDPLRIVLIVAGLVMVVGLYLWERRRRTRRNEASPNLPDPLDHFDVGGFSATQAPAEPWVGRGFAAGDEVVAEHEPAIPVLHAVVDAEGEAAADAQESATDGDVLVLTVIAENPLPGRTVVDALAAVGLVHGRMAIFHYYPDAEGVGDEPWFSAANALEPGTFDLDTVDGAATPGAAFFAQLPGAAEGEAIWEQMLAAARTVAGTLGARLCDDKRQPLDDDQIAAMGRRAQRFAGASAQRQRA